MRPFDTLGTGVPRGVDRPNLSARGPFRKKIADVHAAPAFHTMMYPERTIRPVANEAL